MNPWYQILEENCYIEHDKFCAMGVECFTRDKHVRSHYIPQALKHRVERLQFENKELRDKIDRVEPTDAEVAALIDSLAQQADVFIMPLTASMALQDARNARRDKENR